MNSKTAKELVIKAGLELVEKGLIARTWGNVSCKVDDETFVITPSGRDYESLTTEEIVLVRMNDLSYEGDVKPSSEKGIHAMVYKTHPDATFAIHTHQEIASVISALDIPSFIPGKKFNTLNDNVICAEYALPGTKSLCNNVTDALSKTKAKAIIMKNHGALCYGVDYDEAFLAAIELEDACAEYFTSEFTRLYPNNSKTPRDMYERALDNIGRTDTIQWDNTSHNPVDIDNIIKNLDGINSIVINNTDEVMYITLQNKPFLPILDDYAQIVGAKVPIVKNNIKTILKALKNNSSVFVKGFGAICTGIDESDAQAVSMITSKTSKAYLGAALLNKVKPIKAWECYLMRYVYKQKYSKQK